MNLTDAIGKEFLIFEEKQYTHDDFLNMTSEELATFKARINLKIKDVADIIKKRRKIEDEVWLNRRKYTHSLYTNMMPYLNSLIRERYKQERSISDFFMDAAKVILSPQEFEMILNNATGEMRLRREGTYARDNKTAG